MSESAVVRTLHRCVMETWPNAHWQRLESHAEPGIPDVNVGIPGLGEWWVEVKHLAELPVRETTKVKIGLRAAQPMWLTKRKLAGGRVIIFAKVDNTFMAFDDRFRDLYDGLTLQELTSLAYWTGKFTQPERIFRPLC